MNRLKSMKFDILLGESYVQGATDSLKKPPKKVEAQLVGISSKAMPIGMTIPIGYVRRWNEAYAGPDSVKSYSSIVVDLKDGEDLSGFVAWARKNGWEQEDSAAEQIAAIIYVVTALFVVIAMVICFISAVNIANTFFMLVSERRREIGLMRAVGASKSDIWKIVLGEAAAVGVIGGLIGVGIAIGAAKILDWYSAARLEDYPFKPDTYFQFSPALVAIALGFAVLFCVLGAFLPARKASRIHPAQALTG
jgi:ABC-type lipoprotein release transport system permease subunit